MKVLFIGGTGNISASVSRLAVEQGMQLYLLTRGQTPVHIPGAHVLTGDIQNVSHVQELLSGHQFDAVVNWINYTQDQVERDVQLFTGRTRQYILISSASAYQKPVLNPIITEQTPLENPYWEYSRNKIACEKYLMEAFHNASFPATIVRPSHTYDTILPLMLGGGATFTLADRILRGQPVILHGDGSSLWTLTHSQDFARAFLGLLGNPAAIGEAFHITSDESLTWNQVYLALSEALGVQARVVHVPSDFIAHVVPDRGPSLLGDKAWSLIFDNTKIKQFVPGWQAAIPFRDGIRATLNWFQADTRRMVIDPKINQDTEKILAAYRRAYDDPEEIISRWQP
ncbi:MAG: SDR family oxidoreductase [Chloroflexi bacterium]|nr:SDR family oxidoreductase [Chloroflexota bacterium]